MFKRISSRTGLFVLGAILAVAGAAIAADPTVLTSIKIVPNSIETTAFEVTDTSGVAQFSVSNAGAIAMTGAVTATGALAGAAPLVFEGATADAFETSFTITDPTTPDKSINIPNATGTMCVSASSPLALSAAGDMSLGTVGVANGGTGATTLTDHGVLLGSGTGAVTPTAVGTNGQLLVGQTGADPSWQTVGTDATLTQAGALTIAANAVALTDDTTGNYVASVASGQGISGGAAGSEGATLTLGLSYEAVAGNNPVMSPGECVFGASGLVCEGDAVADTFETTLSFADPAAADAAVVVPGISGTLITTGDTATVDATMLAADSVGTSEVAFSYVASVGTSALTGLTGGAAGSEGAALSVALDYTADITADPAILANGCVFGASGLVCEGSTADAIESRLLFVDPTASDKTISIPNATGTVTVSATAPLSLSAAGDMSLGTVGVANGGTGLTSYTTGDILYASAADTLSALANVAVGSALISGGVGVAPSWGTPAEATHASTADSATSASSAATCDDLAADPAGCSAGEYVSDIGTDGTLTCSTPAGGSNTVSFPGVNSAAHVFIQTSCADQDTVTLGGDEIYVFDTAGDSCVGGSFCVSAVGGAPADCTAALATSITTNTTKGVAADAATVATAEVVSIWKTAVGVGAVQLEEAGGNIAVSAAFVAGGLAAADKQTATIAHTATTAEANAGGVIALRFPFTVATVTVQVRDTSGVLSTYDGGITIDVNRVYLDNSGANDWGDTDIVTVTAME